LAIRDGRLVAAYCENLAPSGAIVAYKFDEETGTIGKVLDKTESWFSEYGDSKGVCFNADGTKVFVTFESDKALTLLDRIEMALDSVKGLSISKKMVALSNKVYKKCAKNKLIEKSAFSNNGSPSSENFECAEERVIKKPAKNGIAVFSISADGKISENPQEVILRRKYCSLENIDMVEHRCVITDLVNSSFSIYDLTRDIQLRQPVQTVTLDDVAVHGAKFAPDGNLLIVSSLGKKVANQRVEWSTWTSPRQDKIFVFERASPPPLS